MTSTNKVSQPSPVSFSPAQQQNKLKSAYANIIQRVTHKPAQDDSNKTNFSINNPNLVRGGLIGIAVSALLSWNSGKYSRLGIFRKRWQFVRTFIMVNRKPNMPSLFTNYYTPTLDTVVKNFMCYSGEAGIGKSTHFQYLAYTQSGIRPAMYVAFKASGKDATFFEDIAQQVQFGGESNAILTQIIKAVKKINWINKFPHRLWLKILFTHVLFACGAYGVAMSSLQATYGMIIFGAMGISYVYYLDFIYPLLIQSFRRTCPLIIFDDCNKIEQLNMFPEIVRFLQLLQNNMANVILISPDQDTWCKLRRQPGVKDRLRVRQIYYDHVYTAQAILNYIKDEKGFEAYMKYVNGNKLYSKQFVVSLVKELIGKRQVTLRRFSSILVLNDQQECESLVRILKECAQEKISTAQAVQKFTQVLYESQTKTMVANLKSIKREVKISEAQFFQELKLLLKKRKLPSDNQIAPHLKAYNIVRDLQSQFVFNGRFMYTVFNMAIQQYEKDMDQFKSLGEKQSTVLKQLSKPPTVQAPKIQSITSAQTAVPENKNKIQQPISPDQAIKNWNSTNVSTASPSPQGVLPGTQLKKN